MPWAVLEADKTSNSAPSASAGVNQSIPKSTTVTLDGSGSSDPDYDFLTYQWTLVQKPNGSQAQLGTATTAHPTLKLDLEGNYVISLAVSDGKLNSSTSVITIISTNTAPIANAGSNQYTVISKQVTLDGSTSVDSNGDTLIYSWSVATKPTNSNSTLANQTSAKPILIPDQPGLYELQLVVNDGNLNSAASTVKVIALNGPNSLCTSDDTNNLPASGSISVGPSQSFIPLCNGWILIGNRVTNTIIYMNAITGQINTNYQLTTAPGEISLDTDNGNLYVSLYPATQLAKINTLTNQQTSISLSAPALYLAQANNGRLFASLEGSSAWWDRPIGLINGTTETVEKVYPSDSNTYSEFLVYDKVHEKLISSTNGLSPSSLYRHSFNPSNLSLTLEQNLWDAGSGPGLTISSDGTHLSSAGGVGLYGGGLGLYDYSPADFNIKLGMWSSGTSEYYYPSTVFSRSGAYLAATGLATTGSQKIYVFSVGTHTLLQQYSLDFTGCDYPALEKVGLSPSSKIVYAYASCGFSKSSGRLFWAVFNP